MLQITEFYIRNSYNYFESIAFFCLYRIRRYSQRYVNENRARKRKGLDFQESV